MAIYLIFVITSDINFYVCEKDDDNGFLLSHILVMPA